MPRAITKTQRWLDLLAYLVGRRLPVAVDELMERLPAYARQSNPDTARRTFERDKDELRKAGIPIETVRYSLNYGSEQAEGYQLSARDFYLPYLKLLKAEQPSIPKHSAPSELPLAEDDARDALEALRRLAELPKSPFAEDARSAYAKLALDLEPAAVREEPTVMASMAPSFRADVVAEAGPAMRVPEGVTARSLADALRERRRVRFRYQGARRGRRTQREVAPYGVMFTGGHWYLVGWDEARSDIREFRLSRMEALEAEEPGGYEVPADFHLRDRLDRQAWELGEPEAAVQATVRFRFPRALWAERNGFGELVSSDADGAHLRSFQVRQPDAFLRWLLSLEGEAELLDPPALRNSFQQMARAVAEVYAGS
jgi:predicted DNA-binding transcriptional regulator YafY